MTDASRTIGDGRYVLHEELASGGMATVHLGRLNGAAGFSRTVAIKRLHPQYAKEADFVSMFIDEARIAARIRHPNVVATLDTVSVDGELFLIMELVLGESLSQLVRSAGPVPAEIAVAIMSGVLHGLHAAHEATDERGQWLEIVHRDVSPQNVIVGVDGLSRVLDFGVAKALGRLQTTRDGQVKGKVAYMAPEQLRGGRVDRRTDVYAASVVLWEVLTGSRLFVSDSPGETMARVLEQPVVSPSRHTTDVTPALDEIVMRGLHRNPDKRFATTEEMAIALEQAIPLPTQRTIASWVAGAGGDRIARRAQLIARIDSESHRPPPPSPSGSTEFPKIVPPQTPPAEAAVEPPKRAAARSIWIIGAAAGFVLLAAGSVRSCLSSERSVAASAKVSRNDASLSDAADSVVQLPVVAVPVARPVAAPSPGVGPGSATPNKISTKKRRPVARVITKKKKEPDCSPPYTIDAEGVHIPKRECR